MSYCTQCGEKLEQGVVFCTNCGKKQSHSEVNNKVQSRSEIRNSQEKNVAIKKKRVKALMTLVAVVFVLTAAIYFILPQLIKDKSKDSKQVYTESSNLDKNDEKSQKLASDDTKSNHTLASYEKRLEDITLNDGNRSISVGSWEVKQNEGTIYLSATNISSQDLQSIFNLYDKGDIAPIRAWATKIAEIAEDAAVSKDAEWNIMVGNECVVEYPQSLSSEDIMNYSGTCGYSIPVLEGNDKDNLVIVLHTKVFGDGSTSKEYILPESNFKKLTEEDITNLTTDELRLARNEIYARHGYIFKSSELIDYFSAKSWYKPDALYDGTLNEVEKYNLNIIKVREESNN